MCQLARRLKQRPSPTAHLTGVAAGAELSSRGAGVMGAVVARPEHVLAGDGDLQEGGGQERARGKEDDGERVSVSVLGVSGAELPLASRRGVSMPAL